MLQLKPLADQEYFRRAKLVNAALENTEEADHLTSESVFGVAKYDKDSDRPLQQYHMRGYIDISDTPILNQVIAGRSGETLAMILVNMSRWTRFRRACSPTTASGLSLCLTSLSSSILRRL